MTEEPRAPTKKVTNKKIVVDPIGRTRAGAKVLSVELDSPQSIARRLSFTGTPNSNLNTPVFEKNLQETVDQLKSFAEDSREGSVSQVSPFGLRKPQTSGTISPPTFHKQAESITPTSTTANRYFKAQRQEQNNTVL